MKRLILFVLLVVIGVSVLGGNPPPKHKKVNNAIVTKYNGEIDSAGWFIRGDSLFLTTDLTYSVMCTVTSVIEGVDTYYDTIAGIAKVWTKPFGITNLAEVVDSLVWEITYNSGASSYVWAHDSGSFYHLVSKDASTFTFGTGSKQSWTIITDTIYFRNLHARSVVIEDLVVDDFDISGQTQGDVLYFDGTNWVRLAKGSAGQVLEMNVGETAPEWDTDDGAGGGTADSAGVDTDGNGTVDGYMYSTTAGAFHFKKGTNVTLTLSADTVTIAATGGGLTYWTEGDEGDSSTFDAASGNTQFKLLDPLYVTGNISTSGNAYINYDGIDGNSHLYFYDNSSPTGAYIQWLESSTRFHLSHNLSTAGSFFSYTDMYVGAGGTNQPTAYFYDEADAWGGWIQFDTNTAVEGSKFTFSDPINIGDSTSDDSLAATHQKVKLLIEDSLNEYSLTTEVKTLIEDSLDEYSLTTAISATYETITNVGKIGDDTASYKATADALGTAIDSTKITDGSVSMSADLHTFTEAELETELSNVTALFTNNVAGDVTISGDASTIGAGVVESTMVGADQINDLDINWGSGTDQVNLADIPGGVAPASAFDFGGATSLEIPAVANPTTDAEGEIAWDANDDAIEVYSGDEAESALISIYKHISIPIPLPDSVATYVPNLIVFKVNALLYPHGIEIDLVSIQLEADAAYSMVIEEWSTADPPILENIISTVTTGATDTYAEEAPDTDAAIDAGDRIVLNIPATDVDVVTVEIFFHVLGGN